MSKKTSLIFGLAIKDIFLLRFLEIVQYHTYPKVHYRLNLYSIFNPNKIRIHIHVVDYSRYHCTLIRFDLAPIVTKKM